MDERNNDFSKMNEQQDSAQTPISNVQTAEIPPLKPANWLWQSIVATILCCLPFGIAGIVFASKVDNLYYNGQYAEAEEASRKAKLWTLISVGAAIIYIIGMMIFLFSMGGLEKLMEAKESVYNF